MSVHVGYSVLFVFSTVADGTRKNGTARDFGSLHHLSRCCSCVDEPVCKTNEFAFPLSTKIKRTSVDVLFILAERVGFEPTDAFTSPVFKTGSLNRSDISPNRLSGTSRILPHQVRFVNTIFKFFSKKIYLQNLKKTLAF